MPSPDDPEDPGSLPPAPINRSLQSGCWITQVAPTPPGTGVCSCAAGGGAADEAVAAAIESAASDTVAASRARIGVRMIGVLPSGYPGKEGIRSTLDATGDREVPGQGWRRPGRWPYRRLFPKQEVLP